MPGFWNWSQKLESNFGGRNGFCFVNGDPRPGMNSGFWNGN